ncbi:hypothetical protein IU438_18560 [Nocardia cyriacigeorgica]|uniref:hypothetical protein n=1 Tax=Nocardia cyriacigeorgica TaxID=135487 RepID=UPI0018945BC3|nr:hypothetical protein [Nocardia cyriacigeorgica]MBF6090341.1 hypothetical protein [Nocardia cyriacigeorgica]MBF6096182.1 hypothetical protein [Nocardia cyriacigeorgica]MBF6319657.1 hypothetical protein [Nocardia cyriacigeorgica]MBF6397796.1 hypothetical protein [Nocardia cyriacigeorgica]MBF6402546.1 hypothetical protein [Nocardia cyriacigeorgica]
MPEWIAGKTVHTPEEAAAAGIKLPTEEEKAEMLRQLDAWNDTLRNAGPGPAPVGGKFSDDMSGTEYEGWRERRDSGNTPSAGEQ